MDDHVIKDSVSKYYGETLKKTEDLKTDACCTVAAMPDFIKKAIGNIHDEVVTKYYGCGLVIPSVLEGMKILDLGSGSGRDCYILSQLVGESGEVVGVDMTDEQLAVANAHLEYHREKFGYKKSNVRFIKGHIEKLDELDLQDNYFDIVISNCVINLSTDKEAVFRETHRVLKDGGELYFSDVYSDRRIPEELRHDKILYGECLSGALYRSDFIDMAERAGFPMTRMVEDRILSIDNDEIKKAVGSIVFYATTYRLFKHPDMEKRCEDYGQTASYRGGVTEFPETFELDLDHCFDVGKTEAICGNTYRMLTSSRFAPFFQLTGDFSTHYGEFKNCGTKKRLETKKDSGCGPSCC